MANRILVVDDSATIRAVVCAMLARHGYDTASASDGVSAIEAFLAPGPTFDLVLLDFVMPKMNGFQFCRALQSRTDLKLVPIVLMSAKADKIREHFVLQTGALDALTKPFDAQTLIRAVEGALQRAQSGWSLSTSQLDASVDADGAGCVDAASPQSSPPPARSAPSDFGARLADAVSEAFESLPPGAITDRTAVLNAIATGITGDRLSSLRASLALPGEAVLSGALGAVPIGAILQLLQLDAMSGILAIRSADSEVEVTVRRGLIDLAEGRGIREEFRLGRYLIEAGHVTEEEVAALVQGGQAATGSGVRAAPTAESVSTGQNLLGERLVKANRITEEQLKEALMRQSSELVYESLRWTTGHFAFSQRPSGALAARARLGVPVAGIIMEGFRRVDEWRVIDAKIGSFDAVLVAESSPTTSAGPLGSDEQRVVGAVDGARTVREVIAASHLSSFDACRVLVQLLSARVLRRQAA